MQNAGLDEAQAGIKIAGRNINNLRYADDTTLMAESEEELKSLLMKVKEKSEKVGLKLNKDLGGHLLAWINWDSPHKLGSITKRPVGWGKWILTEKWYYTCWEDNYNIY